MEKGFYKPDWPSSLGDSYHVHLKSDEHNANLGYELGGQSLGYFFLRKEGAYYKIVEAVDVTRKEHDGAHALEVVARNLIVRRATLKEVSSAICDEYRAVAKELTGREEDPSLEFVIDVLSFIKGDYGHRPEYPFALGGWAGFFGDKISVPRELPIRD